MTSTEPSPDAAAASGLRTSASSPAAEASEAAGGSVRWMLAVVVAAVFSLPFAWVLSYAAMLPFLIGLFFFALFGLVIGAVAHRVAAPRRPYGRWTILAGTTVLVGFIWWLSLAKETRDFPGDMAEQSVTRRTILGDRTRAEYVEEVADQARAFLSERYAPGGMVGYVRWMLAGGEIKKGELPAVNRTLQRRPARIMFAIRVVLSVALLGFGIGSQTFALRLMKDPTHRVIDDEESDEAT